MTTDKNRTEKEKQSILKESFVEKELLQASLIQKELMGSLNHLNDNLKSLDTTLNLIREHEFIEFHKSKWKIFAYQILLGTLFAMGTVLWLIILSWLSYTFFKDSQILRDIVDSQLKMRKFDLQEIKWRATTDVGKMSALPWVGTEQTGTGTK